MSSKDSHQVQELLDRCRDSGLRCTKLLSLTIELFVDAGKFLSAKQIAGSERIANSFDQAPVYRLVHRLEERGIVRRVGLPERAASYALRDPHHQCDDYIICTVCGEVEKMEDRLSGSFNSKSSRRGHGLPKSRT